MTAAQDGMILGRAWKSSPPDKRHVSLLNHKNPKFRKKPQGRILVDGLNKVDGTPIRFKSLVKAERHIKNFGLQIGE